MNGNDLLNYMDLIDPAYVQAADAPVAKRIHSRIKWVAMAACLAILFTAAVLIPGKQPQEQPPTVLPELPMLSLTEDYTGMGDPGVFGYDVSDIIISNPWNANMDIQTLPVWENALNLQVVNFYSGVDRKAMHALLWEIADRLGVSADDITILQDVPDGDDIYPIEGYDAYLTAETEDFKIEIGPDLHARINLKEPYQIPEKFNTSPQATHEEVMQLAQYLQEQFNSLLCMDDPQIDIRRSRYTTGEFCYDISFYEGADTNRETVLNYAFDRVEIGYYHETGTIQVITIRQQINATKIGDYPIISSNEATKMLSQGKHVYYPDPFPGITNIASIELVYRSGLSDAYFMPYYCFYVQLPHATVGNGLHNYAMYYVPAVNEKYLANLTVWNGFLNG